MPDSFMDVVNKKFTTSSGKDVKDTKMLKGEAENSLSGSNSTVQDMRGGPSIGRTGGNDGSSAKSYG